MNKLITSALFSALAFQAVADTTDQKRPSKLFDFSLEQAYFFGITAT